MIVTSGEQIFLNPETFTKLDDGGNPVELAWVPGFENQVAVSKDGRVWRQTTYKIKSSNLYKEYWAKDTGKQEYWKISIGNPMKTYQVHILIAKTWIYNPDPKTKTDVDHIDRNKHNNNITNLRWATRKENNLNKVNAITGREHGLGEQTSLNNHNTYIRRIAKEPDYNKTKYAKNREKEIESQRRRRAENKDEINKRRREKRKEKKQKEKEIK